MTHSNDAAAVLASQITWIETIGGSKIRVVSADFVDLGLGAVSEPALQIRPHGGGLCFVPVRAIARVDIDPQRA